MSLVLALAWYLLWAGPFLVLFFPFATLIHELGHAFAALLLTPHHVQIRIGEGPLVWSGRCGRLTLLFHRAANPHRLNVWRDVMNASSGLAWIPSAPSQRWRRALFALAGPAASLLLSAVCARLALALSSSTPWIFPVTVLCAMAAAVAAIEGLLSLFGRDGLVILHALLAPIRPGPVVAGPFFSDAVIKAFRDAQHAARDAGCVRVATQHLLLALLDEPRGQAGEALAALGDVERARALLAAPETVEPDGTAAGLTIHVQAVLEAAASAAASTGHGRIGTLDLLRGLATHGAGNAAAVLAACGVTADALWQYVQRTPRAEDPSPAFYWTGRNDPAMRTRMCLTFALLCATLTVALGLVDGGGHVILNGMALVQIPVLCWTLRQLRAAARRRVYAGLLTVGGVSLALTAIGLKLLVETEVAILHANGQGALLHNQPFLVLVGYTLLGLWAFLVMSSAARFARKSAAG